MEDLYYRCPTGIYLIENGLDKSGEIIKKEGFSKVFIIYGGESIKRNGYYSRLIDSLDKNNILHEEKGGVEPNPDIEFVYTVMPRIKEFKPDLILAIGGGSVIDTAKSIIHAYYYTGDPLDFNKKIAKSTKVLPLGVILTLSASGSEMSSSCVISSRKENFKSGFNDITNFPTFSILDPSLTSTVPHYQIACGIVDIISHSFERYFSSSSKYELSDYFALSVIKQMVELSKDVLSSTPSFDAFRAMMLCGTASHNGYTSFIKKYNMRCHFVEHQMSAQKAELSHGLGLRFLLANFMEVNKDKLENKIVNFGKYVFDLASPTAEETIEKFENYLRSLELPNNMEEVGFTIEEKNAFIKQLVI